MLEEVKLLWSTLLKNWKYHRDVSCFGILSSFQHEDSHNNLWIIVKYILVFFFHTITWLNPSLQHFVNIFSVVNFIKLLLSKFWMQWCLFVGHDCCFCCKWRSRTSPCGWTSQGKQKHYNKCNSNTIEII